MSSNKKPDWEVKAYGDQLDEIDIDLIAQIVIMLGRQLANETLAEDAEPPADHNAQGEIG